MMRSNLHGANLLLVLTLLAACGDEVTDSPSSPGTETGTADDTGDTGDTQADAPVPFGNPVGEWAPIDHEYATAVVTGNLSAHIDELDASLSFLEDSAVLANIIGLLSGDDDEEEDGDEMGEDKPAIEIDLSGLRDEVVSFMMDHVMVESTATMGDDQQSITYQLSPETFCYEEPEEHESSEDAAEREADEAACASRITETPIRIGVMTDGAARVDLSLQVGASSAEALYLQIHDDVLAGFVDVPNIKTMIEVFADVALPDTMEGLVAGEIRREGSQHFSARFAVLEDIVVHSTEDPISFVLEAAAAPGSLFIDGLSRSIEGELDIAALDLSLPWSDIAGWFHDDEDGSEPAEPVGEALRVFVPAVHGLFDFDGEADKLRLSGAGLGAQTTTVSVDGASIIEVDLNADDGRSIDVEVSALSADDVHIAFSPLLDAQVTFSMYHVADDIEDLPDVLADDTIGIRMDGAAMPAIRTLTSGDEVELQVAAGQLTLWADGMDEDVVIDEGQCMGSTEDGHDLFGGMVGVACGQ